MDVTLTRGMGGRRTRRFRLIVALAIGGLLTTVSVAAGPVEAAYAVDYPTWDEVKQARNNEAAAKAEVERIRGLLTQLKADAESKLAIANEANAKYMQADEDFQAANLDYETKREKAEKARAAAAESKKNAGQFAAQLSRIGGSDLTANLFANGDDADDVLSQMSRAIRLTEQTDGIYAKAVQDQNTAKSLTDQAQVAKDKREQLRAEAEAAYLDAQGKADAAQQALAAEQDHAAELEAQLAALIDTRKSLDASYAEYLTTLKPPGGGATTSPGAISASGWTWPTTGRITSQYGTRVHPISGKVSTHWGTDIAGGCGVPIYAAHAGTVGLIAWGGGYGNYIRLDHGGGISTQYAHIVHGGMRVSIGQAVSPGQLIAITGTTGNSTGCHLHYEVRINGATTDPIPFMRSQGVSF
ncbi:murein DD-endopeptidase MepM/ murein hydrolase activator NlpD [Diaminobutyricimonas aerilata]|uniref:Murein DD-endopeptidase MepM/ murein hydrolase activator NlpD n=2 Tax=Diaminobutyricimonas aerilata TaxID=1162967 RepID=A0A2M9CNE0_9MICO|nr:murein DD-endopeptidase MepM/ murein hydrolase activator NlpD [Diaminobutyricimonas aerilata]